MIGERLGVEKAWAGRALGTPQWGAQGWPKHLTLRPDSRVLGQDSLGLKPMASAPQLPSAVGGPAAAAAEGAGPAAVSQAHGEG